MDQKITSGRDRSVKGKGKTCSKLEDRRRDLEHACSIKRILGGVMRDKHGKYGIRKCRRERNYYT